MTDSAERTARTTFRFRRAIKGGAPWLVPLVLFRVAQALTSGGPGAPTGLTVEFLRCPERAVITDRQPELGWIVDDPRRGAVQSAYQIRIASSAARLADDAPDVWDSGRVESAVSQNVEYPGMPLPAGGAFLWQVRTWDGGGQASPWSAVQYFHTTESGRPVSEVADVRLLGRQGARLVVEIGGGPYHFLVGAATP